MEQNSQTHKDNMYGQIQEEYGKIVYTYTCHLKAAETLKKKNTNMKWIQIILSAVSTGGFLGTLISSGQILLWVGGLCSTGLLIFSAYLKDKDYSAEQKTHLDAASDLWLLREKYVSLLTDCSALDNSELIKRRDKLIEETAKVYKVAPPTDSASYRAAQNELKHKEVQYFSQEELNKMLPNHLRKEVTK